MENLFWRGFKDTPHCNSGIFVAQFATPRPGKDVGLQRPRNRIDDTLGAGFVDTAPLRFSKPTRNAIGRWASGITSRLPVGLDIGWS